MEIQVCKEIAYFPRALRAIKVLRGRSFGKMKVNLAAQVSICKYSLNAANIWSPMPPAIHPPLYANTLHP